MQRPDNRLLSSLRDLRLGSRCEMVMNEQKKRKQKRMCPIKVRPEDQEIYENFKTIEKKKCPADIAFIEKSLQNHFTFSALIADRTLQEQLIEKFKLCKVEKGRYLMRQNDNASSFFILQDGELQVQVNKNVGGKIKNGEGFGELALLYSTPRSASILATKTSQLWFIDRTTFRNVVSNIIEKTLSENKKFINENKFFSYLTEKQKLKIASIAITQRYEPGSKVCKQGEMASAMYIIKTGKLKRLSDGNTIGAYKSGDSLEEYVALKKNCRRKETLIASEATELIALGADEIQKALGKSLPIIILRNSAKKCIVENKFLKHLSKQFIDKVIDCFRIQKIDKGKTVFTATDLCKNKILFFIEGDYQLSNNTEKLSIYGTHSISTNSRKEPFEYSCKMKTDGKIAITTLSEIQKGLGMSVEQAISKSVAIKKIYQGRKSLLNEMKNISKNYQLQNFLVVKKLGEGQFGQVFLVIHKQTQKQYALKCISKGDTIKYKLEKHLINQKKVLELNSSPFTVDFIRSFKDSSYIYFLTEFIDGLELFDALRVMGLVSLQLAQFYTANIILALEIMHSKGIVYRDLKPENVMVQTDGYLKIIDMGTCKILRDITSQKTFTIIGTPNYMSPQILSGKGYGYEVDLWSLGIMLYEFLGGYLPFGENCEDPYEIYEQILKNQLKFPKYMKNSAANDLITNLLNKNSQVRYGKSFSVIKNHEFFKDIPWHQIIQKKLNPTFKPSNDSLFKEENTPQKYETISNFLADTSDKIAKRQDLNSNWDSFF